MPAPLRFLIGLTCPRTVFVNRSAGRKTVVWWTPTVGYSPPQDQLVNPVTDCRDKHRMGAGPFRAGAGLPDMPAWLDTDLYVNVPLEPTYQEAWAVCPSDFRYLVEHGALPNENVPLE
jgi:hypothetical protein